MPRQPRFEILGHPLHVIQRGNNRAAIFAGEADFYAFRDNFADACNRHECLVHAYVFMNNHVHFLMTPRSKGAIGYVMQAIGRRYVKYFNRTHKRTGGLWDGRYRATLIDCDRYLLTCYRYIELNPVRAGLVAHPRQYRWSSYGANALGQRDPLIEAHERYDALGPDALSRQAAYRALFRYTLDDCTLADIREATNKAWVLGELSGEAASRLNRPPHPRAAGRPAKRAGENRVRKKGLTPISYFGKRV